jgi:cell division septation protein DedD
VTDLSHDAEDAFHEIQLSGKQLVFLFMITTVVSVVIFLCGVLVGRGVRAEAMNASATPSPGATAAGPAAGGAPAAAPPAVDPPAPAPENPPLSYPDTLERDKAPTEGLKPAPADTKKPDVTPKSAVPAPPPASNPAPATAAGKQSTPTPPSAGGSRTGWAVQVVALSDRAAAMSVVQRLTGKGYPAFLVSPQSGAPVQNYKVQVGRYPDRSEAEQIKVRLKKEEQFEPWILR